MNIQILPCTIMEDVLGTKPSQPPRKLCLHAHNNVRKEPRVLMMSAGWTKNVTSSHLPSCAPHPSFFIIPCHLLLSYTLSSLSGSGLHLSLACGNFWCCSIQLAFILFWLSDPGYNYTSTLATCFVIGSVGPHHTEGIMPALDLKPLCTSTGWRAY